MNNNAFKDLVRAHSKKASSISNRHDSSKVIARKAVEEEFRKKKRKRFGGDISSSEEEDDGRQSSFKKSITKRQQGEEGEAYSDDTEAVQKELSTRYRDRAKERREGKLSSSTDENVASDGHGASKNLLIVPHNKKGLDLSLVRKERIRLRTKITSDKNTTRDRMPTLNQAKQIMQDFLATYNSKKSDNNYDNVSPMILSSGLVEYLSELFRWETLDVSTWESDNTAAWSSLEHTKFSFAIDGNPSDATRAWEIPRQYSLLRGRDGRDIASSPSLVPTDVMNKITAVFQRQNTIREEMMEGKSSIAGNHRAYLDFKNEAQTIVNINENNNIGASGDDSEDDMFGGLDD